MLIDGPTTSNPNAAGGGGRSPCSTRSASSLMRVPRLDAGSRGIPTPEAERCRSSCRTHALVSRRKRCSRRSGLAIDSEKVAAPPSGAASSS